MAGDAALDLLASYVIGTRKKMTRNVKSGEEEEEEEEEENGGAGGWKEIDTLAREMCEVMAVVASVVASVVAYVVASNKMNLQIWIILTNWKLKNKNVSKFSIFRSNFSIFEFKKQQNCSD